MQYDYIATDRELIDFCQSISSVPTLAFDTEFVSEDRYLPELCLVQVAAAEHLAVIDPLAIKDMTPFWSVVADSVQTTVVHAGRYEFCFCLQSVGRRPRGLFDIQIAAGLIGLEYPAAYSTLVSKLLGKRLKKGETRTDWRRRPLSQRQIDYALLDVVDLNSLHVTLMQRLEKLGRQTWLDSEMEDWQTGIEEVESGERWLRVAGTSRLSRRELAIVHQLTCWRETEAEHQNRPPRRILRDDLIVELARRQSADIARIRAIRGLQQRDKSRYLPTIAQCIKTALEMPAEQYPKPSSRKSGKPQFTVLSQFLATALGTVCRSRQVASSLLGSLQDIRDLVCHRMDPNGWDGGQPPRLASGWRKEVIGDVLHEVMDGRLAIRISDPAAEEPLSLERLKD